MTTRQYKNIKGLKKENLRDNMTTLELVLNMLAEATTTEISKEQNPQTFEENKAVARSGGEVAGIARHEAEKRTGKPVISSKNASQLASLLTDIIETEAEKDEA
jgi:1,6-anhydro-N-acetylmuramate kinase